MDDKSDNSVEILKKPNINLINGTANEWAITSIFGACV